MLKQGNIVTISVLNLYLNLGTELEYTKAHFNKEDYDVYLYDNNGNIITYDKDIVEVTEIFSDHVVFRDVRLGYSFALSMNEIPYAVTGSAMIRVDKTSSLQIGDVVEISPDELAERYIELTSHRTYETSNEECIVVPTQYATIIRGIGHDSRYGDTVYTSDIYTPDKVLLNDDRFMIQDINNDTVTLRNLYTTMATVKFTKEEFLTMKPKYIST